MSKTKDNYKRETIQSTDPQRKTANIIPQHANTQTKVHITNIRRPRKPPKHIKRSVPVAGHLQPPSTD